MKTTIKAKVVVETEKYKSVYDDDPLTLRKIQELIETGHYTLEWINSELSRETEPTLIIKV